MDDDFQFVDLDSGDAMKELEQLRKEVQKLKEQYLSEQRDGTKKLQKEWEEGRQLMSSMVSELKQMEEDKQKLQQCMRTLEAKHMEAQSQLADLREEVKALKNAEKKRATCAAAPVSLPTTTTRNDDGSDNDDNGNDNDDNDDNDNDDNGCMDKDKTKAKAKDKDKDKDKDDKDKDKKTKNKSEWKELDDQCYACKECGTHIGLDGDVINRSYQVGQGAFSEKNRGYLFNNAVNLAFGPTKTETFTSGSYDISSVTCAKCGLSMGWKYLSASNENNATKVGKFCLARYNLTSPQERNSK